MGSDKETENSTEKYRKGPSKTGSFLLSSLARMDRKIFTSREAAGVLLNEVDLPALRHSVVQFQVKCLTLTDPHVQWVRATVVRS